jgi:hypothetical protein
MSALHRSRSLASGKLGVHVTQLKSAAMSESQREPASVASNVELPSALMLPR